MVIWPYSFRLGEAQHFMAQEHIEEAALGRKRRDRERAWGPGALDDLTPFL